MPERRKSRVVTAGNVKIGGNNHIPVQSMLNIPAEDAEGNVKQALELQKAGCEIIRLTVPNKEAVKTLAAVKEKVSIPKLMKKTGLSRGFFYKNPTVRDTLNQAVEQQAGMIDPRREILNMAMEKQIELLNQKVAALTRENKELKRKNEKLQKALRKQDLNFIKNL